VARRRNLPLAVEAPQVERAELHVAAAVIRERASRIADGEAGEDLSRTADVTKSRKELLATIKPQHWKYLREDNGDLPDGWEPYRPGPLLNVLSPNNRE